MKISIDNSSFPLVNIVPDSIVHSSSNRLGKTSVLQPMMEPGTGYMSFHPVPSELSLAATFPAGVMGMKKHHLLLHIQKL